MDYSHSKLWHTRYKNPIKRRNIGKMNRSEYEIEEIVSSRFNTTKSVSSPDMSEAEELPEPSEAAKWELTAKNLSLFIPHYSEEFESRISSTSSLLAGSSSSLNVLKQTRALSNLIIEEKLQQEIDQFENGFLTSFSSLSSYGDFSNDSGMVYNNNTADLQPLVTLIPPAFGLHLPDSSDFSNSSQSIQQNPQVDIISSNDSNSKVRILHKSPAFSQLRTSSKIYGAIPAAEDIEVKSDKNIVQNIFIQDRQDVVGDLVHGSQGANETNIIVHREIKPFSQKSTWTLGIANRHSLHLLLHDENCNNAQKSRMWSLSESKLCESSETKPEPG